MRTLLMFAVVSMFASAAGAAGKGSGVPMRKEDLKVCLDLHARMNRQIDQYNAEVKAGNALADKINAARSELDGLGKSMEAGDESGMAAYNAKVDALNAKIAQHNEHEQRRVAVAQQGKRTTEEFNAKCAGKRFMEDDMVDVGLKTGLPLPTLKRSGAQR
jgi:hypothetical protein